MSMQLPAMPKIENRITLGNILTIALALIPAIGVYAITVAQSHADAVAIPDLVTRLQRVEDQDAILVPQNANFQSDTRIALSQILQTQAAILAKLGAK